MSLIPTWMVCVFQAYERWKGVLTQKEIQYFVKITKE